MLGPTALKRYGQLPPSMAPKGTTIKLFTPSCPCSGIPSCVVGDPCLLRNFDHSTTMLLDMMLMLWYLNHMLVL